MCGNVTVGKLFLAGYLSVRQSVSIFRSFRQFLLQNVLCRLVWKCGHCFRSIVNIIIFHLFLPIRLVRSIGQLLSYLIKINYGTITNPCGGGGSSILAPGFASRLLEDILTELDTHAKN